MSMSGIYGNADDEESIRVIHHALDKGITLLDSADAYGFGHNEKLLGRALKGRRDGVVVATKFGNIRKPDGKQDVDGRPQYVLQACEASCREQRDTAFCTRYCGCMLGTLEREGVIESVYGGERSETLRGKVEEIAGRCTVETEDAMFEEGGQ